MSKKKGDHVIIRNSNMFCSHCGREQAIAYPIEIPVFSAMAAAFTKSHANCVKIWEQPIVSPSLTALQKADFWLNHGERGLSSEFMFQTLSGKHIGAHYAYPHDPSDFKRCHGLLETVSEWRSNLDRMASTGEVWRNLVDNWDKLTTMLEEQMLTKKANGMYELMKSLGC